MPTFIIMYFAVGFPKGSQDVNVPAIKMVSYFRTNSVMVECRMKMPAVCYPLKLGVNPCSNAP